MEILNQYMNNWKSNHASYNLNTTYYYIYQSMLMHPPLNSSITSANNYFADSTAEEEKVEQAQRLNQNNGGASTMEDADFNKVLILSKIQDKLDKMNKIVRKVAQTNITICQNSDQLAYFSDNFYTKKAMVDSELEIIEANTEKIEAFIENNEGKDINDIDEFVKPEDEISEHILEFLADETACEETMEYVKSRFRKKKITLEEYLESMRTLSSQQFTSMSKRRKIMSLVSAHNR